MALAEDQFDQLVKDANGDFDKLVSSVRDALRPVVDGDWAWSLPSGKQVRIDDLDIAVVERIARSSGIDWMTLMRFPAQTPTMAWDVYLECCQLGGEDPMNKPANAGAYLEFSSLVGRIPHDRSTSFEEDGVPLEDDPPTP